MAGSANLPLTGLRVLDLAQRAELTGRLLADLGADVVQVHDVEGDTIDGAAIDVADIVGNAGKRRVQLSLSSAEGQAQLWSLLEGADLWLRTPAVEPWAVAMFDRAR